MSFTNQTKKNTYSGDGVTAAFAFSFPILAQTDLLVQIKDTNGTVTNKTITTHYTVSGTGNRTGFTDYTSGTVTFTAGNIPAATDTVILKRNVPSTQETDYTEKGSFPAETHERALDKLTMLHLQQSEDIDRSIKVDSAVTGFDLTLPTPAADKYLKIKDDISGFELTGGTSINVADDSTPQLGGDLDTNSYDILFDDAKGIRDDSGNEQLIFQKTASAVNHVEVTNAATSNSPSVIAAGDDTNIDLTLDGKGSGTVKTTNSNLDITGNIVVSGTVDGRDVSADGTKLDGIETAADVTDETNVKAALDGATITSATVATGDKVLIQDVDDSDNLRTVTAQSVADLSWSSGTWTPAIYGGTTAGTASYTAQNGKYVKIGDLVYIELYIEGTFSAAPAGEVNISGLPFTSASTTYLPSSKGAIGYANDNCYFYIPNSSTGLIGGITGGISSGLSAASFVTHFSDTDFQVHLALTYTV